MNVSEVDPGCSGYRTSLDPWIDNAFKLEA